MPFGLLPLLFLYSGLDPDCIRMQSGPGRLFHACFPRQDLVLEP